MQYTKFQDENISRLAFGMMRLPLIEGTKDIDEEQVAEMVKLALDGGVNYFDTANPYHEGKSELVAGRVLSKYPRDSYYLATKYPGHQIADSYDPAAVFEDQLKKCRVEYFDFYLLHNINENSIGTYMDPKWGILEYFVEQKKLGRIKHLGFSCHGDIPCLNKFLDYAGEYMEFCQIQLNYLDWELQNAKEKYDILSAHNIPVWVMEPVRGGKLANVKDEFADKLKALRPDESVASFGFRWLEELPNVCTILSGMSNIAQMKDNLNTFNTDKPLNADEKAVLAEITASLKSFIPCTACRYCCDGCPMGLEIPKLINMYNDMKVVESFTVRNQYDALPDDKKATACIGCGACAQICPQHIEVPKVMNDFAELIKHTKSWAEICAERAAAAAALQNK